MSENQQEICPMCQAKIVGGSQALFFWISSYLIQAIGVCLPI
ncbi:MAG: hypothetical protein O4806_16940 [Trichodesmium sp. St5_bin8]|nr:hypothetical protein [Trichodesmium sp. St5_bin8]